MVAQSRDADKIMVRLPRGMRDQLKSLADGNRRSVNAQVVVILEQHLETKTASESCKTPPAV